MTEKNTERTASAEYELSVKRLDLVTRMRNSVSWLKRDGFLTTAEYVKEAVDEIDRLRTELEKYRGQVSQTG